MGKRTPDVYYILPNVKKMKIYPKMPTNSLYFEEMRMTNLFDSLRKLRTLLETQIKLQIEFWKLTKLFFIWSNK